MKLISDDPAKRNKEILMAMLIVLCFIYIGCNAGNICNKKNPNQKRLPKIEEKIKTSDEQLLELSLQTLGNNNLNVIFQFLDPKDTSYAVHQFLSKKQQTDFPQFQAKEDDELPEGIIEYFPNEQGSHVFPFVEKNIKQMFTFETSFSSVKNSDGSNLVYITLSHDGDLKIKFDGQISNIVQNNPIFENIDSVSFVRDQIFLNGENNKLTFHSWKQLLKKFSLKATPIYFHLIRFKLTYKSSPLVTDIYLITNYIQIKKSKMFLGALNVLL